MLSEVGSNSRPTSPAVLDDVTNKKDKNYRRYAATVEKALSAFDSGLQEWADYISFLGRLLKALQTKPAATTDVPHAGLVAKRLAQCLDPRLPSGVHQKALEVYAFVFLILQKEGLSRELSLYLPGISPLLSYASLSVKPSLLAIFENYIIDLDIHVLSPALKAIILALLPGLEDETSEEFEKTHSLLNKLKRSVCLSNNKADTGLDSIDDRQFWQALFLTAVTSASRRAGALQYLSRSLPILHENGGAASQANQGQNGSSHMRTASSPEINAVLSPEPGLLIRCFAAGLKDEQILVQRGFLDLLVAKAPLSSGIFQGPVKAEDLGLLISAAVLVVLRREMSLNRRLWSWFLGPKASHEVEEAIASPTDQSASLDRVATRGRIGDHLPTYFEQYGLEPLSICLQDMITNAPIDPSSRARPFRISLSLMDRSEIGGVVVPRIFTSIMENVMTYEASAPTPEAFAEVLRSANVFFDGIQSQIIWTELCKVIHRALFPSLVEQKSPRFQDVAKGLQLIWFVITRFNVREEEMLVTHMPRACFLLLSGIEKSRVSSDTPQFSEWKDAARTALRTATRLLELVPERAFSENVRNDTIQEGSRVVEAIMQVYAEGDGQSERAALSSINLPCALLRCSTSLLVQTIERQREDLDLDGALAVLVKAVKKLPERQSLDLEVLLPSLLKSPPLARPENKNVDFAILSGSTSVLDLLSRTTPRDLWAEDPRVRQVCVSLICSHWQFLSPRRPQHAVEATRCLWRLDEIAPNAQLVESTICSLMIQDDQMNASNEVTLEGARCFATLWIQTVSKLRSSSERRSSAVSSRKGAKRIISDGDEMNLLARPLSLLLDSLSNPQGPSFQFATSWLQSLPSIQMVLDFVVHRLQATQFMKDVIQRQKSTSDGDHDIHPSPGFVVAECIYQLQTILNVIQSCPSTSLASLANPIIPAEQDNQLIFQSARYQKTQAERGADEGEFSLKDFLLAICLSLLKDHLSVNQHFGSENDVCKVSIGLLERVLSMDRRTNSFPEFQETMIELIMLSIEKGNLPIEEKLLDILLVLLDEEGAQPPQGLQKEISPLDQSPQQAAGPERTDRIEDGIRKPGPPATLLDCLICGISSASSQPILDHWMQFLNDCLPVYQGQLFQVLIPLVECFLRTAANVFHGLKASFSPDSTDSLGDIEAITVLNILLNGLEQTLAIGHQQLTSEESIASPIKSPEQVQGFFGNMVSGVFAAETQKPRSPTANNRLTVLICFKDAMRTTFQLWTWGEPNVDRHPHVPSSSASYNYMSVRLRNRARRVIEHLFSVEPLECLETLIEMRRHLNPASNRNVTQMTLNLLHALEASRPKNTMPTAFNSLYSRTSPTFLDSNRKSTLTSELTESDIASFIVSYTRSIEDDALDEIWIDCVAFLKSVLSNPMPQRQVLPKLLEFVAVLGEKIDNTNFGEQRRMRKEIGDIFLRLLTATLTISPLAFSNDLASFTRDETSSENKGSEEPDSVVQILAKMLPNISSLLADTDRAAPVFGSISTQILGPTIRSKDYPYNITSSFLDILKLMSRLPETAKLFKKDMAEAFNDSRFFCFHSLALASNGWLPLLKQWTLVDKDRMSEILARLVPPTSAGIMFGVGASSARLEADRKAQLNLRRIALLVMAGDIDEFIVNIDGIQEKITELANVTQTSSPSSTIRAELYMLMRALILKVSAIHLAWLWPILNGELQVSLASLISGIAGGRDGNTSNSDLSTANAVTPSIISGTGGNTNAHSAVNVTCVLQAAKLLDLLLTVSPEDFQLREWLYVTDTIEAVYRTAAPADWKPVALVDRLAHQLDDPSNITNSAFSATSGSSSGGGAGGAATDRRRAFSTTANLRPSSRNSSGSSSTAAAPSTQAQPTPTSHPADSNPSYSNLSDDFDLSNDEETDTLAPATHSYSSALRKPLLRWHRIRKITGGDDRLIVEKVLRPFLRQLSIVTFEATYRMQAVDRSGCEGELLRDLFDDGGLV